MRDIELMKHFLFVAAIFGLLIYGRSASAAVWGWEDKFIASFVDAECINRHPTSPQAAEKFDGQMTGTFDAPGPGVDLYYHLVNAVGAPVDNAVAGLDVYKPNGADWLGLGPVSGLAPVLQWGKQLHMDATGFDSLEIPVWYKSGAGPLDVRAFCVTGTASGAWVETQINSSTVTFNQGDYATLTVDLTTAPDRTRLATVAVVVEAHNHIMQGRKATLHVGSPLVATVTMENYGPNSAYRWMDAADQLYSVAYRNSYSYDDAHVEVTYNTVGRVLSGTLTATNLKPNFAYQFKLIAEPIHRLGDFNYGTNELIGLNGRWWQQEWTGSEWTVGWNLNDKGDGTSPNPNDNRYLARRNLQDPIGGSPTGLRYRYSGYRVFDYFITDENGNATLNYTINNSYHVLWKTWQRFPGPDDGPIVSHTFDVDPQIHSQYDTDYPPITVGIFGEWERLPKDGVGLLPGDYLCDMLLTEESFHGSGLQGFWAHAMRGTVQFTILPEATCTEPIVGDLDGNCTVNLADLAILALNWLQCNLD